MKILNCSRQTLVELCSLILKSQEMQPLVAEVGVLKGTNALKLYETLKPKELFLIDPWSAEVTAKIGNSNLHRDWVSSDSASEIYYGGSLQNQTTFDNLYQEAKDKFVGSTNVNFIRATSWDGMRELQSLKGLNSFDFIYLDGAHDFETVFDDLMNVRSLLSENSFLQLNDCCYSTNCLAQNIGVLEAVSRFIKFSNFIPLGITSTDFSDLILCPKNAINIELFNHLVENSDLSYVEVPDQLLPALSVKLNRNGKACMSFV
jgi:hypothetical protein